MIVSSVTTTPPTGNAVAEVRVGHQVHADRRRDTRLLRPLPPQRLVGLREQRLRQKRVHVDAHRADARQHVVRVRYLLNLLQVRHFYSS